jgi:cytochrome c oxidase subunit 3
MIASEREVNSLYAAAAVVVLAIVTATFGALIFVFIWRSQNGYLWGRLRIPSLLWMTTVVLLVSSVMLERARRSLRAGDRTRSLRFLQWTTALGFLFLIGQGAAWLQVVHSNVSLKYNKHAWFIFLFSGMHAVHILAGLGGLAYLLHRSYRAGSGPRYQMTTRAYANALAIFWHYLGFMWVVLFGLLLTWRR